MSVISRLDVLNVRNLSNVKLLPAQKLNLIFGDNGSGKTSLLEAIHLLGLGRSFRSQKLDSIIQNEKEECVVFCELAEGSSIGLSKSRRQGHQLKLMGEKQRNWADAARHLPVQILNSESFLLLEGSSKVRRRYLDWGVFHVEQDFVGAWRKAAKCLAHRNLLLKQRSPDRDQLAAWDIELCRLSELIDSSRSEYFALLCPALLETVAKLIDLPDLNLQYCRGWDNTADLASVLKAGLVKDLKYGATQHGPHRADLVVKIGRSDAVEILSRGQQKLLVSAMKVAQGYLLSQLIGVKSVYLLDDLPSELDASNRRRVCALLDELDCQVFMTCVDPEDLEKSWPAGLMPRKFHVEHGKIAQRY
ncbi:MAG: DNA replication/repair protein RecF [Gammaproteobacteria bacterium]|nr:DNA replication/repair protein RecF [Gammaproteobacteria bacterium]